MTKLEISLLTLLFILVFIICLSIFYFYKRKKEPNKKINIEIKKIKIQREKLTNKISEYNNAMLLLVNKNKKDIEEELINSLKNELENNFNSQIKEHIEHLEKEKESIANNMIIEVMERVAEPIITDRTTVNIILKDDSMKGRIIGKEGRHKRIFENLTGTDLIIDKDSNIITISSTNPIRREIAKNVLNKLLISKNIESNKIELIFKQEKEDFEKKTFDIGKDIILNTLNIKNIDESIYKYVGRLKYRSSFGQNALSHSVECSLIASDIADKLNLNTDIAKRVAFFHDIGKSNDYEVDKTHIQSGLDIAKECNLDHYIINAISSHHGEENCNNIYSEITKIADTISASRPGARVNSYEEYFSRVKNLEDICNNFDEVENSYVIKSGRQLRVIINPNKIANNENFEYTCKKIKDAIESNEKVNKYKIKVIIVKEERKEFETTILS